MVTLKLLKRYQQYLWNYAYSDASEVIFNLLEKNPDAVLLDCGCDTGDFTIEVAEYIGTKKIFGIDCVEERLKKAQERGVIVYNSDLNKKFPIEDEFVDVVIANQVIEHLYDIDNFAEEIHRVLKPGGYAIVSTVNLASVQDIFALLLGYQPFSSSNISNKKNIGNPLALHKDKNKKPSSFTHVKIFAYRAFIEIFELYGFKVVNLIGSGYFPFPRLIARALLHFDPRHAAFLTIKVKKCARAKQ